MYWGFDGEVGTDLSVAIGPVFILNILDQAQAA